MANAIHKTEPGETFTSLCEQYYALRRPDGRIDAAALSKVATAIRAVTPPAVFDFTGISIDDPLPAGSTVFIPTLRELNRVVFSDKQELSAAFKEKGFDHARKLVRYTPQQVIDLLSPLPPE